MLAGFKHRRAKIHLAITATAPQAVVIDCVHQIGEQLILSRLTKYNAIGSQRCPQRSVTNFVARQWVQWNLPLDALGIRRLRFADRRVRGLHGPASLLYLVADPLDHFVR